MNKNKSIILVILSLLFVLSCNDNFFYELIPPDNDRITEFVVDNSGDIIDASNSIDHVKNTITFQVEPDFNFASVLVNKIKIDKDATIIPITDKYIKDILDVTTISKELPDSDLIDTIKSTIKNKKTFNKISLENPLERISFDNPTKSVKFMVISGLGTSRIYTVYAVVVRIETFSFDKSENSQLKENINIPDVTIDQTNLTISILVPLNKNNNPENKSFIANFTTFPTDATVTIDGKDGGTLIDYKDFNNTNPKKLSVTANGMTNKYDLIVEITPDVNVIYFEFRNTVNSDKLNKKIDGDVNNTDKTILVNIPYVELIDKENKTFVATYSISGSPSSVTIGDSPFISGDTSIDYSSTKNLVITAKDKISTKTYTITVNVIPDDVSARQLKRFWVDRGRASGTFTYGSGDIEGEIVNNPDGATGTVTVTILKTDLKNSSFAYFLWVDYTFDTESTATINGVVVDETHLNFNFENPVDMIITDKTGATFTYTITVIWPSKTPPWYG